MKGYIRALDLRFYDGIETDLEGIEGFAEGSSYIMQRWYCILIRFFFLFLSDFLFDYLFLVFDLCKALSILISTRFVFFAYFFISIFDMNILAM